MHNIKSITAAAAQATSNQSGLLQMTSELKECLLEAEKNGYLRITAHNANYCTLQGAWATPTALIQAATHFEMIDDNIVMLKQGGRKMRAFEVAGK